jgi:hypothetical protein
MTRSLPSRALHCLRAAPCTAALLLAAASLPALAFNPQPDPPGRWATVGLVMDQTVRLSVLAVPVERGVPPDPCTVTFNFLDAYGQKLAETRTMVLLPGQMRFVDLKGSDLRLPNHTDRVQVRTEVRVLHNPPADHQCNGAVATVEVFDATGRSSLVLPGLAIIPPDPY